MPTVSYFRLYPGDTPIESCKFYIDGSLENSNYRDFLSGKDLADALRNFAKNAQSSYNIQQIANSIFTYEEEHNSTPANLMIVYSIKKEVCPEYLSANENLEYYKSPPKIP